MKNLLILLFCFISYNALANSQKFEVLNAQFGVEDVNRGHSLCLTVLRSMENEKLYAVLEDITDCYIARAAQSRIHQLIRLDLTKMKPLTDKDLRAYLQIWGPQLKFFFSEGD